MFSVIPWTPVRIICNALITVIIFYSCRFFCDCDCLCRRQFFIFFVCCCHNDCSCLHCCQKTICIDCCNLFFIYNAAPFDPDLVLSTGNDNQGIDVYGMPTVRSIGFNIKLEF